MATDAGRARFVQLLRYNQMFAWRICVQELPERTAQSFYSCSMMLICVFDCFQLATDAHPLQCATAALRLLPVKMQCSQECPLFVCRDYKQDFVQRQDLQLVSRLYTPFAPIAAISFPFFWAPSFGEFGSATWRKWAVQFKQCQIQTRCCVWHALDLTRGA